MSHVEDAAKASEIILTKEEIAELENKAYKTGLNTKGAWEKPMV